MFEKGMKLKKVFDGRIVTISSVSSTTITLDGDFEPKHVIMKDKVLNYYSIVK